MKSPKKYQNIITIDPKIKNGEPCIRGLPITVKEVMLRVFNTTSINQILAEYPELTIDDLKACSNFYADQPTGMYLH